MRTRSAREMGCVLFPPPAFFFICYILAVRWKAYRSLKMVSYLRYKQTPRGLEWINIPYRSVSDTNGRPGNNAADFISGALELVLSEAQHLMFRSFRTGPHSYIDILFVREPTPTPLSYPVRMLVSGSCLLFFLGRFAIAQGRIILAWIYWSCTPTLTLI